MASSFSAQCFFHSLSPTASRHLCIMLLFLQLASALVLPSLFQQSAANPLPFEAHYAPDHLGAVASQTKACSQIGIDLLSKGGNAADAVSSSRPGIFEHQITSSAARRHRLLCWCGRHVPQWHRRWRIHDCPQLQRQL